MSPYPEIHIGLTNLERLLGEGTPYFGDAEDDQAYSAMYVFAHDVLVDCAPGRIPQDEARLALARARLMQLGLDESRLPWELSVSFNLRLAEGMEQEGRRPRT